MSKYKHQAVIDEFRRKFTVFDGHQNIVKHVTYSSWVEQFLDEQLSKKEEEVLNSKKKRVVLVLEFSVDANGTPQIVETWDYDKKILNQFTSMQLGVIILGLLEEKRKHHKNFLPLIERFCEIFLAHYKNQTKK